MARDVREVGDVVRILNEVTAQLGRLSGSDLDTLNHTLMHAHSHVVHEQNGRQRRSLGDVELPLFEEEPDGT